LVTSALEESGELNFHQQANRSAECGRAQGLDAHRYVPEEPSRLAQPCFGQFGIHVAD
jgi:hypothetical protein